MMRPTAALLLALALGGCASSPPVPPAQRDMPLSSSWTLQGRIGIKTDEQSLSGQIHWQIEHDNGQLWASAAATAALA